MIEVYFLCKNTICINKYVLKHYNDILIIKIAGNIYKYIFIYYI